jgi:hypothetical protein
MSSITFEIVSFLEGLVYLFKSESKYELYCKNVVESFGLPFNSNQQIKNQLIKLAETCFNDERILIPENNGEYPEME